MKKIHVLLTIAFSVCCFALLAWKASSDNSAAKARQVQGLYIFTDCQPVGQYNVIGTVSGANFSFKSGQYESVRDKLIKRAKADYPQAAGLILDLRDGGTDRADVIIFK